MARGRPKKNTDANKNGNGANLGFEAKLWATADKLRGNMEPSDYKHVALGLIFLKYISDAFEATRAALLEEELADALAENESAVDVMGDEQLSCNRPRCYPPSGPHSDAFLRPAHRD